MACGNGNGSESKEDSDEPVIIEFAHHDSTGETEEKVKRFNKENDDIQIKFVELPATPTDKFNKFSTWFNSESKTPDVLLIDITWPGMYAAADWIAPIDSYLEEEDDDYLDRFWDVAVDAGQIDGKQYGIQGFIDVGLNYYRKDLLDKYDLDVPETWDEMIETTEKVRKEEGNDDLNGFIYQGDQIEGVVINFLEFLWGIGGEIEVDGEIRVDTPEAIEALTLMQDLIYEEKVSPVSVATSNPDDNTNLYGNGETLFMRNWPSSDANLKKTDVEGKYDVTTLFHGEDAEESYPSTGGWMPVINNFSEHKDEAWEVIKFYLSDEEQESLAINSSQFPTVESVYEMDDAIEAQPLLGDLSDMLENAKARPVLRNYEQFSRALQKEINLVLNNEKTPEEAVKDAQKDIDEEVNE
ncbi:MAG TPA: ABC transporter substrate-binding protein [Pseudogracilibacillus sp.]|nr:ABC transporter substrate-binding protein [Pseudogracilibacillus sp.]